LASASFAAFAKPLRPLRPAVRTLCSGQFIHAF